MFTASRKQIYIPLANQDGDEESLFAGLILPSKSTLFSGLCVVLALLASFIAGTMYTPAQVSGYKYALYSNGNSESEAPSHLNGLAHRIPLRAIAGEIVLNSLWSREPESGVGERDGVWSELIPAGLGYLTESVVPNGIDSKIVIPAAFHQLHCLRTLRKAYYARRSDGTDSREAGEAADVARCFDYLAQSIICEADSTVEPVDYESGGGFQRQCWDFEALSEYVQDRRVSGGEGV